MLRGYALALLSLPPLVAAQSPGELWETRSAQVEAAREALAAEDWPTAHEALKAALEVVPNHPRFLQQLALAGARHEDRETVVNALRRLALSGIAWPPDESLGEIAESPEVKRALVLASANRLPKGEAASWYEFDAPEPLVEGIAPTGEGEEVLVGDLGAPRILRGSPETGFTAWSVLDQDEDLGVFGIQRHPEDGRVLACLSDPFPQAGRPSAENASVVVLSLEDGRALDRRRVPPEAGACLLGDAVFGPDETIFATDSTGGRLFRSDRAGGDFSPLGPEKWPSPQGLVWDPRRACLFVADYSLGVFRVDPQTGEARRLDAPPTDCLVGIDGLYAFRGGLVAVQNGTLPARVLWLSVDPAGERIRAALPLLAGDARLHDPTLGFVRGDRFTFVARSPWPFVQENAFARPPEASTLLLQIRLIPSHE